MPFHYPRPSDDAELTSAFVANEGWADSVIAALSALAPPAGTPTVTFSASLTSGLSSPVEYRPVVCGTGSKVSDWDGQNDPNFRFHHGLFNTQNGGNADLALYGTTKPGGGSQAATWPIIIEFNTSSGVGQIEIGYYGSTDPAFKLEVNGFPSIGDFVIEGPSGLGNSKKALLTFPDARVRRIRLYIAGGAGFHSIRVPTGQSISKPAETLRTGVFIGDSFVNGTGSPQSFPAGAGQFDTFAPRVLKALGCNDLVLAGIGGTGVYAGTGGGGSYLDRVPVVLAMEPDVLVFNGSINDGPFAAELPAALDAFLAATESVSERYVVGTMRSGHDTNYDAMKAGAASHGVPFVEMRNFLDATGGNTATPTGLGNGNIFLMPDAQHPTYMAHRAAERAIFRQIVARRPAL